jgi:hypothetical protein
VIGVNLKVKKDSYISLVSIRDLFRMHLELREAF